MKNIDAWSEYCRQWGDIHGKGQEAATQFRLVMGDEHPGCALGHPTALCQRVATQVLDYLGIERFAPPAAG